MTWKVEFDHRALKELRKLEGSAQERILRFLRQRIAGKRDPRRLGRPLTGLKTGLWRYRAGAYRIVCRIEDETVVVLILRVAHRRDAYR